MRYLLICFFTITLIIKESVILAQDNFALAISQTDFVGFVMYDDYNSVYDHPILRVVESFKGYQTLYGAREIEDFYYDEKEYFIIAKAEGALLPDIQYFPFRKNCLSKHLKY